MTGNQIAAQLPAKYIIAVIGDADAGKTTTINKVFEDLSTTGKIRNVNLRWGKPGTVNPVGDFSLTGKTVYGLTGISSAGDVMQDMRADLNDLIAKASGENGGEPAVIFCACRKERPRTFSVVAEIAWQYGYTILWVPLACPAGTSLDVYTDGVAARIAGWF